MRSEYRFSYFPKLERGKYYKRLLKEGSNVVVLDRDVAREFPDSASVNRALRSVLRSRRSRRHDPELRRASLLGLVGTVTGGPRDVAERHSEYLKATLRNRTRRTR